MRCERDGGFGYRVVPCQQDPDDPKVWIVAVPVSVREGDWLNIELPNESHLGKVVSVTIRYEQ